MSRFYLYRLFKHSMPGFVLAVIFLFCYAIFFYKKIDSVFFPYNSMFSIDFTKKNIATTYSIKVNAVPVKITHKPYWKKDFLEQSLSNYCRYKKKHAVLFMTVYLEARIGNKTKRDFLLERLTPDKAAVDQWPFWYLRFAGYEVPAGATIELLQYDFIFENNAAILKDSISIYKTSSL